MIEMIKVPCLMNDGKWGAILVPQSELDRIAKIRREAIFDDLIPPLFEIKEEIDD